MKMTKPRQFTIQTAIKEAKRALKKGNLFAARKLYTAVLQHQPNHLAAKKGLAGIMKQLPENRPLQKRASRPPRDQVETLANLYNSGRITEAEKLCKELLRNFPESLVVINIWGAVLKKQERTDEAAAAFEKAVRLKPDYAEAYNNLGICLKKLGNLQEALKDYDKAIKIKPEFAEAYNNRGIFFRDLGRFHEALDDYKNAIRLKPDYTEAYNNLGNLQRDLGRLQEALGSYNEAVRLNPDFTEAFNNRGIVLKDLGRFQEAFRDFGAAIRLRPDYADAYNNRGNALKDFGRIREALDDYNRAVQLEPEFAEAYNGRGASQKEIGRFQEALSDYENAIRLKPDFAEAYNNRGVSLKELGRDREASNDYKKALQLKPDFAEAHRHLSTVRKYKGDDNHISAMESLLEADSTAESDRMHLCFALAKAYEDLTDYDKSFQYLKKGNDLRKKALDYKIDKDRSIINRIKAVFDKKTEIIPLENSPVMPVFIVGMPRSGTTLVEQILASHSRVYGAGELNTMNRLGRTVLSRCFNSGTTLDHQQSLQKAVNELHDGYLESLTDLHVKEKVITDKMPVNFIWIGFIFSAFPEAKIINMNRDPRATCWSIYKHFFSSKGNGYAYDMVDLAEFYHIYVALMAFWRDRFPGRIYDLCYEELTEDQEEETRKLLTYCGLEMEAQCIDFHKTERVVQTASAAQVRKKMYTGSSEAWKKYERHIQPMIELLPV